MRCSEAQRRLSAYHDAELDKAGWDASAAHARECQACQAYLRQLARLSELLRAGRTDEPPDGLWDRIGLAAKRRRRQVLRVRRLVGVAAMAAGFVLYLLGYELLVLQGGVGTARSSAPATQVEALLQDTALTLGGRGLADDDGRSFARRPEVLLVRELTASLEP